MNRIGFVWNATLLTVVSSVLFVVQAMGEESLDNPERVSIGQEAPLFDLESLDGDLVSLKALQGESPLVLIFFRGTW